MQRLNVLDGFAELRRLQGAHPHHSPGPEILEVSVLGVADFPQRRAPSSLSRRVESRVGRGCLPCHRPGIAAAPRSD